MKRLNGLLVLFFVVYQQLAWSAVYCSSESPSLETNLVFYYFSELNLTKKQRMEHLAAGKNWQEASSIEIKDFRMFFPEFWAGIASEGYIQNQGEEDFDYTPAKIRASLTHMLALDSGFSEISPITFIAENSGGQFVASFRSTETWGYGDSSVMFNAELSVDFTHVEPGIDEATKLYIVPLVCEDDMEINDPVGNTAEME